MRQNSTSTELQFIFLQFSTQCSVISADVDSWHLTQKVVACHQFSSFSYLHLALPQFFTTLNLNCITLDHHFLFNSCSAFLCVLPDSKTTWASCSASILVKNIVENTLFCMSATVQLMLLLDCWCLVRAPCCCIPRTADTQIQELQIPSIVTFQTSHTACLHCTCRRQQQKFIGAVNPADKNSSHPPHVQFGSIL